MLGSAHFVFRCPSVLRKVLTACTHGNEQEYARQMAKPTKWTISLSWLGVSEEKKSDYHVWNSGITLQEQSKSKRDIETSNGDRPPY